MKQVKDVMTRGVEVVQPGDSLRQAADKMRQFNIGPVPVCDGQKLVGMVTDRDIVVRGIAMGHDPNTSKVSSVMTADVEYIFQNASLDEAADLMRDKQIRRLLVLDDDKRLVGIVSLGDLSQQASQGTTAKTLEDISEPAKPER